jgi:hypothetical protein
MSWWGQKWLRKAKRSWRRRRDMCTSRWWVYAGAKHGLAVRDPGVRVRWSKGGSAGSGGEVAWKQEVLGKGV